MLKMSKTEENFFFMSNTTNKKNQKITKMQIKITKEQIKKSKDQMKKQKKSN